MTQFFGMLWDLFVSCFSSPLCGVPITCDLSLLRAASVGFGLIQFVGMHDPVGCCEFSFAPRTMFLSRTEASQSGSVPFMESCSLEVLNYSQLDLAYFLDHAPRRDWTISLGLSLFLGLCYPEGLNYSHIGSSNQDQIACSLIRLAPRSIFLRGTEASQSELVPSRNHDPWKDWTILTWI